METKLTLPAAYNAVLGGVLAISPALYASALDRVAALLGRENNDDFRKEVRAHELSLPAYED